MSRVRRTAFFTKHRNHEATKGFFFVFSFFVFSCWLVALSNLLAQQAPDRSRPPTPGPPPALQLPQIQRHQLANGLPVWIVELHKVPVAQVNLVVLGGTAAD